MQLIYQAIITGMQIDIQQGSKRVFFEFVFKMRPSVDLANVNHRENTTNIPNKFVMQS